MPNKFTNIKNVAETDPEYVYVDTSKGPQFWSIDDYKGDKDEPFVAINGKIEEAPWINEGEKSYATYHHGGSEVQPEQGDATAPMEPLETMESNIPMDREKFTQSLYEQIGGDPWKVNVAAEATTAVKGQLQNLWNHAFKGKVPWGGRLTAKQMKFWNQAKEDFYTSTFNAVLQNNKDNKEMFTHSIAMFDAEVKNRGLDQDISLYKGDQVIDNVKLGSKEYNDLIAQGYTKEHERFKPGTTVNVNTTQGMDKLNDELAKGLAAEYEEVSAIPESYNNLQEAKKLLDSGVITGTGANFIVGFGKVLQQVGFDAYPDAIKNTEAYAAYMGKQVASIIKQFGSGTGLSDADREYAEKIAGGKITLTEKSLRKIIELNEKAMKNTINSYSEKINKLKGKPGYENILMDLEVKLPESSDYTNMSDDELLNSL